MLKRKTFMALMPLLTAAVVIGTGFSLWHFGETRATNTHTTNVEFTSKVEHGVSVDFNEAPSKLVLDQGDSVDDKESGIRFDNSNRFQVLLKSTATRYVDLRINVTMSADLADYLDWQVNPDIGTEFYTSNKFGSEDRLSFSFHYNNIDLFENHIRTLNFNLNTVDDTYNTLFNWKKKPTTSGEYDDAVNLLKSQTVKFEFQIGENLE